MAVTLSHSFTLSNQDQVSMTPYFCTAHTTEEIRMFCKDCDDLVCTRCIIVSHNGHHFDDISIVAMEKKDELIEILKEVRDKEIPNVEVKIKKIQELREKNKTQSECTIDSIKRKEEELRIKLQALSNACVSDTRKAESKNADRISKAETKIKETLNNMQAIIETCQEANDSGDNINIITTLKKVKSNEIPKPIEVPSVFPPRFIPGELTPAIVELKFGSVPDDFEMEVSSDDFLYETKTLTSFKLFSSGVVSISPDAENMAFVRCHKSSNVNLVDARGGVKQTINVGTKIDDVTCLPDGTILLSCPDIKEIIQCSKAGKINKTMLRTTPLIPCGICKTYNPSDSFLVCLCEGFNLKPSQESRRLVEKFDLSGNSLGKIELQDVKPLFTFPSSVSAAKNGNIAVLDLTGRSKGRIYMFDLSLKLKFTFRGVTTREDNRIQTKFWPGCACFDQFCNLLVTDMITKSVYLLDGSGNLLKLFQTSDNTFPRAIGILSGGQIWIGNSDGKIEILEYKR